LKTNFFRGRVGTEWKFCGMGGDESGTGRGRLGTEIKFAGTGEYWCNFCPRAGRKKTKNNPFGFIFYLCQIVDNFYRNCPICTLEMYFFCLWTPAEYITNRNQCILNCLIAATTGPPVVIPETTIACKCTKS